MPDDGSLGEQMQQTSLTDREWREAQPQPWRDKELLEHLYVDELTSIQQIGERWGCSPTTVSLWLEKHGIEKRTREEAARVRDGTYGFVPYQTRIEGPELWHVCVHGKTHDVYVHRLVAVAEYGFDAVCDMDVHHKNEIPWDNRPENLELMDHAEHRIHHQTKIKGLDRIRIAELYEHGDISYRKLHEALDYDVSWHTIMTIHKEFYGDD